MSSLLRTAVNLKIRGLSESCNEASLDKMDQDMAPRPTSAASVSTPSVSGSPEKPSPPAQIIPGAHNNNSSAANGEDEIEHHHEKQLPQLHPLGQALSNDVTPPPPKRKRGIVD